MATEKSQTQELYAGGELLNLVPLHLERLEASQPPTEDVGAAREIGTLCHQRMLALGESNKAAAIPYAVAGAKLLAAVQSVEASQPDWVAINEEQCCSCAAIWIHTLSQSEFAVPTDWIIDAVSLLDRLQTLNPEAQAWAPRLQSDLREREPQQFIPESTPTIAALINYFNDEDMLRWQLDEGFLEGYDRIYIWDGPYSYVNAMPLFPTAERLDETDLGRRLLADSRVVYNHSIWKDEGEKRIDAYCRITEDIIVLHDTDEFLRLDSEYFKRFWCSAATVASVLIENIYAGGIAAATEHYSGETLKNLPSKWIIFKRAEISAERHIDYIWLVGVDQKPLDETILHSEPLAHTYHLTGCRNKRGQSNKLSFYMALYMRQKEPNSAHVKLQELVANKELTLEQAQLIMLGGNAAFTGVPHPDSGCRLKRRLANSDFPEELIERILSDSHPGMAEEYLLLDHYPLYLWVPGDIQFTALHFCFEVSSIIQLQNWCWLDGQPPAAFAPQTATGDKLTVEISSQPDLIGHLLMIQASSEDQALCWQQLRVNLQEISAGHSAEAISTGEGLLDQARSQLDMLTPGLQGEMLHQKAALAFMQAGREGIEHGRLKRELQAFVLQQLNQAIKAIEG